MFIVWDPQVVPSEWFPSGTSFQYLMTWPCALEAVVHAFGDSVADCITKGAVAVVVRCNPITRSWFVECDRALEPFHMFTGYDLDTNFIEFLRVRFPSLPKDWLLLPLQDGAPAFRTRFVRWERCSAQRHVLGGDPDLAVLTFGELSEFVAAQLALSFECGAMEVLFELYPREAILQMGVYGQRSVSSKRSAPPTHVDTQRFLSTDLESFYRLHGAPPAGIA
ncbi:hypothetical protein HY632_03435 [Candidatus Uhrbacteria bacterium]|nr:hypothetical protein [Candidatus Uhrbacteria bacterium]